MKMILKYLIIFLFYLKKNVVFTANINSFYMNKHIVSGCQIANYCQGDNINGKTIGCSIYGNCDYNLTKYYNPNESQENKEAKCICNLGYSSYDVDIGYGTTTKCCYKQRSQLTGFLLELFLGFGIGNFYLGNYLIGILRITIQLSVCFLFWCTTYLACNREEIVFKDVEVNTEIKKELKESEIKTKDKNDSKLKKDEYESLYQRCPKSMILIYFSLFVYFSFTIIDITLIGFGIFKDANGEKPYMWQY